MILKLAIVIMVVSMQLLVWVKPEQADTLINLLPFVDLIQRGM